MFSVTRGSKYEIWQEMGEMCLDEAMSQGKRWSEKFPDEEIVVYENDPYEGSFPVWAMNNGEVIVL